MIRPWLIMYHTWRRARNWEKWASEQLTRIARADIPCPILISNGKDETETLMRLRDIARSSLPGDSDAILYLHQKGITHQQSQEVQDHREMMEYFCIDKWQSALASLDGHGNEDDAVDAVGCNLQKFDRVSDDDPEPWHFGGNFWWARGSHLTRLPAITPGAPKTAAERWVCLGARLASLHDSGVDHYFERYQPERYQ